MTFTLFVPKNTAVFTLPRKPHLGTAEDGIERLSDHECDEQSRKNIARRISAHAVPRHPIKLMGSHPTMLGEKSIDFECKDEGEKTWEHCTHPSQPRGVQRSLLCY
ncbi:hypothetical protein RSAG8_07336, partial [Rhizoctonia solani AG-8 WAC10335]